LDFAGIAADGAAAVLMVWYYADVICADVICTDLDGNSEDNIEKEILACEHGSTVLTRAVRIIFIS